MLENMLPILLRNLGMDPEKTRNDVAAALQIVHTFDARLTAVQNSQAAIIEMLQQIEKKEN